MSAPDFRSRGSSRSCAVDPDARIQGVGGALRAPLREAAVDQVQIGFVRRGSVAVVGRFGRQRVGRGELVTVAPQLPLDVVPGPDGVDYTSVLVDGELLAQTVAWERPAAARAAAEPTTPYDDRRDHAGFTWTRIGEASLRELEPALDELVALTRDGQLPRRFKRAAGLLFTVLDAIGPVLDLSVAGRRPPGALRPEVHRAVALLESDLARPWPSGELAAAVGLSAGHLRQLFLDGLGRTPLAHHNLLRARRAQELLADRERSIPDVMAEVGWTSPSHWTTMFRRHAGMTPREYREQV